MTVELTDQEFQFIYTRIERLMDPVATREEIIKATRAENEIWKLLKEIKGRADGVE